MAPSLAGAYSPNLKTAFISLVKYSDWLGSHPNPSLVKNYVHHSSDLYRSQVVFDAENGHSLVAHFTAADSD